MEITPIVKEDFVVIDDEETVSEMIGKLKQMEKRSALVFRNKKYQGLVVKKRLLRTNLDMTETKVKNYIQKTPIITEHADVIETSYLMFQSNLDFLPVERNKEIVGVLNALDVAQLGASLEEAKGWKVSDIKLLKSPRINRDAPISTVIEVMNNDRVDHLPIFDGASLYGVISYRDIMRKYLNWSPKRNVSAKFNTMASTRSAEAEIPHIGALPVESFATTSNIIVAAPQMLVRDAIVLMQKNKVTSLPILQEKQVIGLLEVKNILRKIASLKIPKNYNIRFVGLGKLDLEPHQKSSIQKISSNEAFKLQRVIKNDFSLTIHIKEYEKDGHSHKYSVSLRIEYPSQIIATSDDDWDVETALRKTFANAKNHLAGKFKESRKRAGRM